MELISFVIWVLMAVWCYNIAEKNGRSGGLAAVWGLLFGIFAVIVYYLLGKKQDTTNREG